MKRILFLCLLLISACNLSPGATLTVTPPAHSTNTPDVTPTYEGCYYVWASQDMPELSQKLQDSLRLLGPNVTGGAYAFGEDCVYGDGRRTFGAMETDFRVEVKVKNLKDEQALGTWIFKVMQVIEQLPPEELPGGQPGRVEFTFAVSDTERLPVNVSIDTYRRQAEKLKGAELFRFFYNKP
jgi:hypothetical protein